MVVLTDLECEVWMIVNHWLQETEVAGRRYLQYVVLVKYIKK